MYGVEPPFGAEHDYEFGTLAVRGRTSTRSFLFEGAGRTGLRAELRVKSYGWESVLVGGAESVGPTVIILANL